MKQEDALDKNSLGQHDQVKFWRASRFDEMECLSATFVDHHYPKHMHDTYIVGVMLEGAEKFSCNGQNHVATKGDIAVLDPFITHDGYPEDNSFAYRMMYPSMELMEGLHRDVTGKDGLPHFEDIILKDDHLADRLCALHNVLEKSPDSLEQDSAFALVLTDLIQRHSDRVKALSPIGNEAGPVSLMRHYLDDMFTQDVALDDLAHLTGLNRHYLIRAFRKNLGMTPHAYQTMRRAQAAKQKLERGELPIEVAMDCGFCDQSHLNRIFKKHYGLTPGQFRTQFGH